MEVCTVEIYTAAVVFLLVCDNTYTCVGVHYIKVHAYVGLHLTLFSAFSITAHDLGLVEWLCIKITEEYKINGGVYTCMKCIIENAENDGTMTSIKLMNMHDLCMKKVR